jgi:hypothetical protein
MKVFSRDGANGCDRIPRYSRSQSLSRLDTCSATQAIGSILLLAGLRARFAGAFFLSFTWTVDACHSSERGPLAHSLYDSRIARPGTFLVCDGRSLSPVFVRGFSLWPHERAKRLTIDSAGRGVRSNALMIAQALRQPPSGETTVLPRHFFIASFGGLIQADVPRSPKRRAYESHEPTRSCC